MRRKKAEALKTRPLVRIMGFSRLECPPGEFVVAPVKAVRKLEEALASRGAPADFPVMEMNESFGLLRLLFAETWPDRTINPRGGSVALKHPLGAAGARLLTTLIFTMLQDGYSRGISSICFGSGGACAIAVEDVSGR